MSAYTLRYADTLADALAMATRYQALGHTTTEPFRCVGGRYGIRVSCTLAQWGYVA
jgi:hypothetical protein